MLDFINVVNTTNLLDVKNEVIGNHFKNSKTINEKLIKKYPEYKNIEKTKIIVTKIFEKALEQSDQYNKLQWEEFFKALDRLFKSLYDKENSLIQTVNVLRMTIKNKYPNKVDILKMSYDLLGLSKERMTERKEQYKEQVKQRNMERNKKEPIYIEDVIDRIKFLKTSLKPYNNLIAVLLATGLRSIEVLKVSEFVEEKEPDDETIIKFKYLAKRPKTETIYHRPLIGMTNSEFFDLLKRIRNHINTRGSNKNIANRANVLINAYMRKYFNFTSHKARYIYANIAYILFGKPKNLPYESYIQTVLNHESGESTKSYLGINIKSRKDLFQQIDEDSKKIYEAEILRLNNEINKLKEQLQQRDMILKSRIPEKPVDITDKKEKRILSVQEKQEQRINNVIAEIKNMKAKGVFLNQRDIRNKLGYSSDIVTKAYKRARTLGILN